MSVIIPVQHQDDIFPQYRDTPIAHLLEYHNLHVPYRTYTRAEMLIGTCMDFRIHLQIPEKFSYIIRTGGANLRDSDFHLAFGISVGGAGAIAVISHSDCGMVNLMPRQERFVEQLAENAGATSAQAEELFLRSVPVAEVGSAAGDEIDFVVEQARELRRKYPKIVVAPLHYRVEDHLLYQVEE